MRYLFLSSAKYQYLNSTLSCEEKKLNPTKNQQTPEYLVQWPSVKKRPTCKGESFLSWSTENLNHLQTLCFSTVVSFELRSKFISQNMQKSLEIITPTHTQKPNKRVLTWDKNKEKLIIIL